MTVYFINPHQNHSLGKVVSNAVTLRHTSSKMSFVFEAVMESGMLGVLKLKDRFPEMSRLFPNIRLVDDLDFRLWSSGKRIEKIITENNIHASANEDYLILTTKDAKYRNLAPTIEGFKGKIVLLLDDHLFSTHGAINSIIEQLGSSRITSISVVPIKDNPHFSGMPISQVEEKVVGWPVSSRFSNESEYNDRESKVLALGTLTYRMFNTELMDVLVSKGYACVHPDREYLHNNAYNSPYVDSKIPIRDYRFQEEGDIGKILRRLYNRYTTARYNKINMPELMNKYKFVAYPPLFNDLPCLGMLEAMASGAILIGTDSYAYKSLGLIDGYNYISLGSEMDLHKINFIVEDEIRNSSKYANIQKNSIDFAEKYKKLDLIKKAVMSGLTKGA